jgi:hypothetical protein
MCSSTSIAEQLALKVDLKRLQRLLTLVDRIYRVGNKLPTLPGRIHLSLIQCLPTRHAKS